MKLHLSPNELQIVLDILYKHLKKDFKVWVFGSRAGKKIKKFSDLDLAIEAKQPLSLQQLASISHDFEESSLPFKVDIVDWLTISDSFRNVIETGRIELI